MELDTKVNFVCFISEAVTRCLIKSEDLGSVPVPPRTYIMKEAILHKNLH